MHHVIDIIPHEVYVHSSGRTASMWGACPWQSEAERHEWTKRRRGWTWMMDDGTIGLGRQPTDYTTAVEVANRINGQRGGPKFPHPDE